MKFLVAVLFILGSAPAWAADTSEGIMKDFDSLGGNDVLLEQARALNPEIKIRIVQKRIVERSNRHEFATELGMAMGGNAYTDSQTLGLAYQYHINPKWSVGARYNHYFNQLSKEGENLLSERVENGEVKPDIPDNDYAKSMYLATVNWYPIYGKFNFLDRGVVHFDTYLLLGGGQVALKKGTAPVYTTGIGFGLWFSQHLTARMEFRYQLHEVLWDTGTQELGTTIGSLSVGYLL